jgi:hypothetical protein
LIKNGRGYIHFGRFLVQSHLVNLLIAKPPELFDGSSDVRAAGLRNVFHSYDQARPTLYRHFQSKFHEEGVTCIYLYLPVLPLFSFIYLYLLTCIYLYLLVFTFIYLYLPLVTCIYLYLLVFTFIYLYLPLVTCIYL